MWKPDSTPENTWTIASSKSIIKHMSEPEYFFRTLLYVKKIGLAGHHNICNTYSDMYIVRSKHSHWISISEDDTDESDEGRDMYWSEDIETSIERKNKSESRQEVSIIERKGQTENLLRCSETSDKISIVNIHIVWFEKIKNTKDDFRQQSHSNMLIFDHTRNKIYLFDPYGVTYSSVTHIVNHSHQALKRYMESHFYYEYMGDIHRVAREEYPSYIVDDHGPQSIQEMCRGTAACHQSVTCQGWSAYFLLKLASDVDIDPVFSYAFMITQAKGFTKKKRNNSGISEIMVTMLDVGKHIIEESNNLLAEHHKEMRSCKKNCFLDIMNSYLRNRIPEKTVKDLSVNIL